MNLKELFPSFIRTLEDSEIIDDSRPAGKKADYFFDSRNIICEQKSLDNDMIEKIEQETNNIFFEKGILAYGTHSIDAILRNTKDYESLKKRIYDKLTKSLGSVFEKPISKLKRLN